MNADLTLELQLLGRSPGRYEFALSIRNDSPRRFLLPAPAITGLGFAREPDRQVAEWYTHDFVSAYWNGFALEPSAHREFTFRVVACSARQPPTDEDILAGRDDIWCVHIHPGAYVVTYTLRVDEAYFDADSHWDMQRLRRQAESERAEVWTGEAYSNEIQIVHEWSGPDT